MIDNNSNLNRVAEAQAQELNALLSYHGEEPVSIMTLLKKIPLLSGLLRGLSQAGNAVNRLVRIAGSESEILETLGTSFQYTGVVLNTLDFLRIPFIYLAAIILHKKPPVTLSKNVRLFYSAVMLSLTIIAIVLPMAVPPIALVLAALPVAFNLVTMAKTLYKRYKVPKELKRVNEEISAITNDLTRLNNETKRLEAEFDQAKLDRVDTSTIEKALDLVTSTFDQLIVENAERLRALSEQKFKCKAVLEKHSTSALMDKGVGLAVAAIILVGVTLSLFFPPLGMGILAGGAMIGVAYIFSRFALPLIKHLFAKKRVEVIDSSVELTTIPQSTALAMALMVTEPRQSVACSLDLGTTIEQTTGVPVEPTPPSLSVDHAEPRFSF